MHSLYYLYCFPYLWSLWVRGVVEVVLVDGEESFRTERREISQLQCLKVVNLLHQSC